VNEDDAGSVLLALLEEIADTARANTHEHLDKVRTRDGEEWNTGFTRYGTGQEGLTGSRRSDQQHTFGNAPAEFLESLRLAAEFDDLLKLFFGLFDARNIFECDLLLLRA